MSFRHVVLVEDLNQFQLSTPGGSRQSRLLISMVDGLVDGAVIKSSLLIKIT